MSLQSLKSEGLSQFQRDFYAHDWAATSLGAPSGWPEQLRMLSAFILETKQPMFLIWGEEEALLFNEAFERILGPRAHEALGMPIRELWAPIWKDLEPYADLAWQGHSQMQQDIPFRTWASDYRETRYFTFSHTPFRDAEGQVVAGVCIVTDTTEKVLAQRRLSKEHEALRTLFEQAPVFLAYGSLPSMRFEYVNRAYRDLIGIEDLIGRKIAEALPDEVANKFMPLLQQVATTGEPFFGRDVSVMRETPEGPEERFADFVYQPTQDEKGVTTGILCVGSDVTEEHRAKERSALLEDRLRQNMRLSAMGTMAATLAHELNQPLTAAANYLIGARRVVESGSPWPAELLDDGLERAQQQVRRAADIIRRVRGMVSNRPFELMSVPLGKLVEDTMASVEAAHLCKDVRVGMDLHDPAEKVLIELVQTEQVLVNLVRNACSAMTHSRVKRLTIATSRTDTAVEVCVRDTGAGLPNRATETLFTPFASSGSGLGLGLAISRTIVEAQGGHIWAEENPGGGAAFTFTLPLA